MLLPLEILLFGKIIKIEKNLRYTFA